MNAATILRAARGDRRWTQQELADALGVKQPQIARLESKKGNTTISLLDSYLRETGHALASLPTRLPTIAAWAEAARELHRSDPDGIGKVLVQIADDLASVEPATRVALCVTPPARTGSDVFDALLAGLVEHVLAADGLPVPSWVNDHDRVAAREWDLVANPKLAELARETTPPSFSRRRVFVPADLLESV